MPRRKDLSTVMLIYGNERKFTADDEEPDCMVCQNVRAGTIVRTKGRREIDYCSAHCGNKHCWGGYVRYEEVKNE